MHAGDFAQSSHCAAPRPVEDAPTLDLQGQMPTPVDAFDPTVTITAVLERKLARKRQRVAEELIQNDPLVQELIRDWGAKIVPGSIRPLAAKPI